MTAEGKITTSQATAARTGSVRILVTEDRSRGVATYGQPEDALFAAGKKTGTIPAEIIGATAVPPQRGERNQRWNLTVKLDDGTTRVIRALAPSQTLFLAEG